MTTPVVAHTINIHVNTSSPPHPPNASALTVSPPTINLPANVSPKKHKGKVAVSSQTNEQVWHLTDDTAIC